MRNWVDHNASFYVLDYLLIVGSFYVHVLIPQYVCMYNEERIKETLFMGLFAIGWGTAYSTVRWMW